MVTLCAERLSGRTGRTRIGWTRLPPRLARTHPRLVPHVALRHTSCLSPGLALRTTKVQPPRHGIDLHAVVKLCVNERSMEGGK
jgi:hypothetical protein